MLTLVSTMNRCKYGVLSKVSNPPLSRTLPHRPFQLALPSCTICRTRLIILWSFTVIFRYGLF